MHRLINAQGMEFRSLVAAESALHQPVLRMRIAVHF